MYGNYLKKESNRNKNWNVSRVSLEHKTLPLLTPRSTDWANGPFDTKVTQINIFKHWMYENYLKREGNPNKKWNLVRMSLEQKTLPFEHHALPTELTDHSIQT